MVENSGKNPLPIKNIIRFRRKANLGLIYIYESINPAFKTCVLTQSNLLNFCVRGLYFRRLFCSRKVVNKFWYSSFLAYKISYVLLILNIYIHIIYIIYVCTYNF